MNLLAGFTALNFNGVLTRFIPQAGSSTKKLVTRAYLVSAAASVAVAIPFLLTIRRWGPAYAELAGPIDRPVLRRLRGGLGRLHPAGQRAHRAAQRGLGSFRKRSFSVSIKIVLLVAVRGEPDRTWASTCPGCSRRWWPCRWSTR